MPTFAEFAGQFGAVSQREIGQCARVFHRAVVGDDDLAAVFERNDQLGRPFPSEAGSVIAKENLYARRRAAASRRCLRLCRVFHKVAVAVACRQLAVGRAVFKVRRADCALGVQGFCKLRQTDRLAVGKRDQLAGAARRGLREIRDGDNRAVRQRDDQFAARGCLHALHRKIR